MTHNGNLTKMEEQLREKMMRYWQVYKPSLESMMLSNDAQYLAENEQNELLSYLPPFKGMNILELGAGIGRFTSRFAQIADHVTAVDFMESYIKENEERNGHFENITFQCADATKKEFPEEQFDMVFTNWLLMYLSYSEAQKLMAKIMKWLKPGGFFFFRESCYHQSGNVVRAENPTQYRTPLEYFTMLDKTSTLKNKFQICTVKNVLTYIHYHGNPNQICLLARKTGPKSHHIKDIETNDMEGTKLTGDMSFRTPSITDLSAGQFMLNNLTAKLGLRAGHRVLNVGCGVGGVPMYLVKNHDVQTHGVDALPINIHYAIESQGTLELSHRKKIWHRCLSDVAYFGYHEVRSLISEGNLTTSHSLEATPKIQYESTNWLQADFLHEAYEAVLCFDFLLSKKDTIQIIRNSKNWLKFGGKFGALILINYENSDDDSDTGRDYLTQKSLEDLLQLLTLTLQEVKQETELALKYLPHVSQIIEKTTDINAKENLRTQFSRINKTIQLLERKQIKLVRVIAAK